MQGKEVERNQTPTNHCRDHHFNGWSAQSTALRKIVHRRTPQSLQCKPATTTTQRHAALIQPSIHEPPRRNLATVSGSATLQQHSIGAHLRFRSKRTSAVGLHNTRSSNCYRHHRKSSIRRRSEVSRLSLKCSQVSDGDLSLGFLTHIRPISFQHPVLTVLLSLIGFSLFDDFWPLIFSFNFFLYMSKT